MFAADQTVDTHNNFNLLRLLFAVLVVVYHVVMLSGVASWRTMETFTALGAEIGVQGFFVLSGYLVWRSFERSRSIALYAEKRARRVLPAYVTVVLVCTVAALVVSPAARADLAGVARYLGWNVAFLNFMEPALPGLFQGNTFTEVNGALWTLKIEVLFYIMLPLLALLIRWADDHRWVVYVMIYVLAEIWRIGFEQASVVQKGRGLLELSSQLPGQMSFFIVGVALATWREDINWRSFLAPGAVILLIASLVWPAAEPVRALGLGVTTIWIATVWPRLFDAAKFGDLSYGLYISHFPIIQGVVAVGLYQSSPVAAVGAVIVLSLVAALLLWWAVERPALRNDSGYRGASGPAARLPANV